MQQESATKTREGRRARLDLGPEDGARLGGSPFSNASGYYTFGQSQSHERLSRVTLDKLDDILYCSKRRRTSTMSTLVDPYSLDWAVRASIGGVKTPKPF